MSLSDTKFGIHLLAYWVTPLKKTIGHPFGPQSRHPPPWPTMRALVSVLNQDKGSKRVNYLYLRFGRAEVASYSTPGPPGWGLSHRLRREVAGHGCINVGANPRMEDRVISFSHATKAFWFLLQRERGECNNQPSVVPSGLIGFFGESLFRIELFRL